MKSKRKFTSAFKAKVAIEAVKEQSSLSELSSRYELEVSQISKWKKEFLEKSSMVFEVETPKKVTEKETKNLYEQIGCLNMQVEFLKKSCRKLFNKDPPPDGRRRTFKFEYSYSSKIKSVLSIGKIC
ncbi:MAG: transposase [Planctomycetaceae bacterium]|jgi:transposase-like protein|nr:transposase [Planctomycetaceae bacterium]